MHNIIRRSMAPRLSASPHFFVSFITVCFLLFIFVSSKAEDSWVNRPSSVTFLEKLAAADLKIARLLYRRREKIPAYSEPWTLVNGFLEHFEEGTPRLQGKIQNWKEWAANLTKKEIKRLSRITGGGPLSAVKLIKRQQMHMMTKLLWSTEKYVDLSPFVTNLPDEKNLKDAVEGLLRIQHIHDLSTLDMAEGLVVGVSTGVKMNAGDCYTIGNLARDLDFWALSVEWLNLSMAMAEKEWPGISTNDLLAAAQDFDSTYHKAQNELLQVAKMHDDLLLDSTMLNDDKDRFFANPLNLTPDNLKSNNWQLPPRQRTEMARKYEGKMHYKASSWALCQGKNLQTEKEKSRLFCWFESLVHPYFLIGPLKVEVISESPVILQFYEIMGKTLRQKLWNVQLTDSFLSVIHLDKSWYTIPVFRPDKLGNNTEDSNQSNERRQVPLYLRFEASNFDEQNETLGLVPHIQKMEMATGLEIQGSDLLRYYTYNFAGQISPHIDRGSDVETDTHGWRIATFMAYMNDVELGGETIFPFAGVAVKPVKGAALFWFNIHRNGLELDDLTLHAGCPPIVGRKTIAQRWISFNYQFHNVKCPLDQKERFDWNFFKQKYKALKLRQ